MQNLRGGWRWPCWHKHRNVDASNGAEDWHLAATNRLHGSRVPAPSYVKSAHYSVKGESPDTSTSDVRPQSSSAHLEAPDSAHGSISASPVRRAMSLSGMRCIGPTAWFSPSVLPAHHCISRCLPTYPPTDESFHCPRHRPVIVPLLIAPHGYVVKMLCMPLVSTSEQSRSCSGCEQHRDPASKCAFLEPCTTVQHRGSIVLFRALIHQPAILGGFYEEHGCGRLRRFLPAPNSD